MDDIMSLSKKSNDNIVKENDNNAKSIIKKKPARLQIDPETIPDDDKPPQTGTNFNIWFLKWSGGDSSNKNFTKSNFRVNIDKDCGYTKANDKNSLICLFFARGCCYLGKQCHYLHRIPNDFDYFIPTKDCFGRDKTSDYNDDMNGIGSFNKVNRTLYIGNLNTSSSQQQGINLENLITKNFQDFGEIEKIRVLHSKKCCFLTYKLESQAQFAKEAMQNQSLIGIGVNDNDILNIRWSNDDPNPDSQRQEKRKLEELTLNTITNLLNDVSDSNNKRSKVTVEEVEEEDINLPQREQLSLPSNEIDNNKRSSGLFGDTDLSSLKFLRKKKQDSKAELKQDSNTELKQNSLIQGYSSSDEE